MGRMKDLSIKMQNNEILDEDERKYLKSIGYIQEDYILEEGLERWREKREDEVI